MTYYDTYERSNVARNLGAWLSERDKCYTGAVCNAYCGILDEKCALTENQLQHPHSTLLAHGATGRHYNEIPVANADHEPNTRVNGILRLIYESTTTYVRPTAQTSCAASLAAVDNAGRADCVRHDVDASWKCGYGAGDEGYDNQREEDE